MKPNDLKCSHGGKVSVGPLGAASGRDASGKGTISSGINKDTKVCKISPHSDKHVAAADLAKKATKLYLDDLKKRLGIKKMKTLLGGGPTLAMAIDTTGSMGGIIALVKDQAIQIVDSRLDTEEEPSQYILVPFNDPNVGPATVTDDPKEFKAALRNLSAGGGGDCPEFAMTGMLQALDNMDDGDELLMFSDASSKDGYLTGQVESQAIAKGVKISPVSFGSCSPIDPGYLRLAEATGGQVFQIGGNEAGSLTKLVDFVVRASTVDLLHVSDSAASGDKTYLVPVDSTMTRVTFSISSPDSLAVIRPDGTPVDSSDVDVKSVTLSGGQIYSIINPARGSWNVIIQGNDDFTLRVSGESSLDFSYFRFVDASPNGAHPGYVRSHGFPQVNETRTVIAQLSAEAATVNLELRAPNGTALQQVSTEEISWANDNPAEESFTIGPVRKFIGDITTPGIPFRAYATGLDGNGFPYQRAIAGGIKPQTIRLTAPAPTELVPGQTTTYTFEVTNLGTAATFNLRAADDNNFVSNISPATVTLGANETRNVLITLAPPATAGDKALDTLTVTAQGTGASDAFNSATVQSIVKATLNLALDNFTATEEGGNGNGIVEAGENGSLVVQLVNTGGGTVTGIHATVAASSPGVTVNDGSSDFPNIEPSDVGINSMPFTFSLAGNTSFGLSINLTLTVTYAGAAQPFVITLSVPVGGSPPLPPDQIIFSTFRDGNQEIYRINPDGDELVNLTNSPSSDFLPIVSPDMSKIAFVSRRDGTARIYVMNANGTSQQPVTADANDLAYESKFSWSPDGAKLAFVKYINFVPQISVINIDGSNETARTNSDKDNDWPAWSPDGTKIAFTRRGDFNNNLQTYTEDLFLMGADGSDVVQLTTNLSVSEPAWSPDGGKLVFVTVGAYNPTFERHNSEIRVINADGSNLRQLTNITRSQNPSWSHDGSKIVFASNRSNNSNFDIFLMNADGTSQVNLINDGTFNSGFPPNDLEPALSPDGTQIAYTRLGTDIGVVNTNGTGKLSIHQGQFTVRSTTWLRPGSSPPTGKAVTATNLASSNPNSTYGDSITLTATVTSSAGTPGGTVEFFDGLNSLGTTTLNNGVASLTTAILSSGAHSLKAVYTETENFAGSESGLSQAVALAPLSIKAADSSRIFGVSNPAFTVSYSGFKLNDDSSALSGTLAFGTQATIASNVGAYLVVPAGVSSPNYSITFVSGTLTINRAPTQTSADSRTIASGSSIALSGTLKNSLGVALSNRTVSLTLGTGVAAQSCSSLTNSSGVASCSITNASQPLGPGTVSASFAGDGNYLSSSATAATLVYAYPAGAAGGEFVVGDLSAQLGASVTFWGSQWAGSNALSGGSAPSSFKGFANSTSSTPVNCGGTWTTGPGNSSGPPNTVPAYMAVIVASAISKSGSTISGNIRGLAIVRTNSGYGGNPGHAGRGTIVQMLCMQ